MAELAIYSRKSRFTGKGESVENQIELCRQYIAAHRSPEQAEQAVVYEDEGFSGGTLDRPQFRQMMQAAEAGKLSAIVVYRLDRISRNIADFAGLIGRLERLQVDFISIREQFDTGSPMGRAMMYMSSVFSQLERETIAERIRDNMHELSKTGRWLGGITPTGYASECVETKTADGRTKRACRLKILRSEIWIVEQIYAQYLAKGSLTAVDAWLLEQGIRTKNGRRFSRFSIRNILTNPVYLKADQAAWAYLTDHGAAVFTDRTAFDGSRGVMAYNRTLQQAGRANRQNPMDQWIVALGEHAGVISGNDWVRVQQRLEANRTAHTRRTGNSGALLSGILRCGQCGDYLRPKKTGRIGPDGKPVFSYLCTTRERSRGTCCNMKSPAGNLLDSLVLEQVCRIGTDRMETVRCLEREKSCLERELREEKRRQLQTAAICRKEKEIAALVETLPSAPEAATPYVLRQIEQLHEEIRALQSSGQDPVPIPAEELEALAEKLADFGCLLMQMTPEQQRSAVRTVISAAVWDADTLSIQMHG